MIDIEKYDSGQAFANDLLGYHLEFTLLELAQCASRLCAMLKEVDESAHFGEYCEDVFCPRCGRWTVYYMHGFVMECVAGVGGCGAKPRIKMVKEEVPPYPDDVSIADASTEVTGPLI